MGNRIGPPYYRGTGIHGKVGSQGVYKYLAIGIFQPRTLSILRDINSAAGAVSVSSERLSSGLRINKAGDDSAGLSISQSLQLQTRVYTQGIRNLNDGTSLLNIADSALQELENTIIRIKELAHQASNGTYSVTQRRALNTEAQQLAEEYFRISRSASFNGVKLFDGSLSSVTLQNGFGVNGSITSSLGGALGTGTFAAGVSYNRVGSSGTAITTGDLNGDGNADYVALSDGYVVTYLGNGQGGFTAASTYSMDTGGSEDVVLGDLNNDGILDLVTSGVGAVNGSASIRFGNGNGTFGGVTHYNTNEMDSHGVTLADLNGDGSLDIVTTGWAAGGGCSTVLLNTGSGSFQTSRSYTNPDELDAYQVVSADINGDGKLDLATIGKDAIGDAFVTVRYGTGQGTFGTYTSYSTGGAIAGVSVSIRAADINGDQKADLIASSDDFVSVFLTTASGLNSTPTNYSGGGPVALADVNGDGAKDIVRTGSILLGTGSGTFTTGSSLGALSPSVNGIAVADFNGDGVQDVVTNGFNVSNDYSIVVLGNTRSGVAPLLPFDLTTKAGALQSIAPLQRSLEAIIKQRGTIGAALSRLQFALPTLSAINESSTAAISRIRDTDVAEETASYVRNTIKEQAATAVLAQANQSMQIVVGLLKAV